MRLKYLSNQERSDLMRKVRSKDTKAELVLRRELYKMGVRYRINVKSIKGKPDIAIKKYKLAVFVDGEFWHGKDWEVRKSKLRKNRDKWIAKIERNMARDIEVNIELERLGYKILRFWAQDIMKDPSKYATFVVKEIEKIRKS